MTKSPHPSSVDKGELLPCPFCGSSNIDARGWMSLDAEGPACDDCGASAGSISLDHADNIAAWNTRQAHSLPGDVGMAEREALAGYRAAVSFISADSWDGCSDCINILKAARAADFSHDQHDQSVIAAELTRIRMHYSPADAPFPAEPAVRWEGTEDEQHAARMKVCAERRKRWPAETPDDDCDQDGSCEECTCDMADELETKGSLRRRLAYWKRRARAALTPSALSGDAGEDGGRIIRFSDEKGDFVVGEDGCTIFWPEGIARGGFNAWHLRALAGELDRRNADWMAQMHADFAALPSQQGTEP